jgi:hypothetical protein
VTRRFFARGEQTTSDTSAWYFGNNLALSGIVVALALWAFWKAVPRRSLLAKT